MSKRTVRKPRRRLTRLLPYLAIVALPVIALVVFLRAGPFAEHLRRVLESEFSRQLGREVSIARASISLSGRVTLHDVVVENPDGSVLLRAPQVGARVGREGSWLPLLSQPTEVQAVTLVRPEVSLRRDASGTLSIDDLLARQAEKPSRFRGDVVVQDGRLVFVDEAQGGLTTVIEGADLKVQYPEPGRTTFSLAAEGSEGAFARLEVKGETDAGAGTTHIQGSVADVDAVYALARLPAIRAFDVSAGRTDVEGEFTLDKQAAGGPGIGYDVKLDVRDATVSFPWLRRPVNEVKGRVRLANGDVHLSDLSGAVAEAPITASGVIENLQSPTLNLDVAISSIRYPQVRALFPTIMLPVGLVLPSPLRITARVEGPASDVKVTGEGTVRVIKFRAIPWNDLVGKFEYSGGRLKLSGFSAHGSPRTVEAEGLVDWSKGRSTFGGAVSLSNVPLTVLAQMAGIDVGDLQGTVTVTMDVGLNGGVSASGAFELQDAVISGVPVGRARGQFELAGKSIRISNCRFEGPLGSGAVSGRVSATGAFEAEARFSSLHLALLADAAGLPGTEGTLSGSIAARGDPKALSGAARIELGPGEVAGKAFSGFRARLAVSPERLEVSDMTLSLGAGEYRSESLKVIGWPMGWKGARIGGKVTVTGAAVADWLPPRYASLAPEGRVDGEVTVSGTPADPGATLDLRLESVALAGQSFAAGRALVRYEGGGLVIEEMFLDDRGSRLVLKGSYDPETGLDLGMAADPLDLRRVASAARQRYGVTLAGEIRAAAKVTGPLDDPRVEFRADSDSISVNEERVEKFTFLGRADRRSVHVDSGSVGVAGGELSFSGMVNLRARETDIALKLADLDLGRMYTAGYLAVWRLHQSGVASPKLAAYANIPHPLNGSLTADVRVEGPLDGPRITAENLAFTGLGYAGRQIGRIAGDPEEVDLRLELDLGGDSFPVREATVNLVASDAMGDARLSGEVTPEGEISLVLDSLGYLDLSLLGPWLQYPLDLEGQATINFDVSGPISAPVLRGDILVDQLKVGPFNAEQATASPITGDRGMLVVEEVKFTNPPAGGKPPMEATGKAEFPLFWGAGARGAAGAAAPSAELHVRNGSVELLSGILPPTAFDANVYLNGDQIELGSGEGDPGVRVKMGSGTLEADGSVSFRRSSPPDWRQHSFDITFTLDSAQVAVPGLLQATLDGSLWLTNAEAGARARAQQAAWSAMDGAVGVLSPSVSLVAREMWEELYGYPPAMLKTREESPLVASDLSLVVPKLGSLIVPGGGGVGPSAEVEIQIGTPGAEPLLPTQIAVDLGLLRVKGPATGTVTVGGELSGEGYALDGKVEARDGEVAFPNAVLRLSWGTVLVARDRTHGLEIRISDAEAVGRVGDYNITLRPAGRVYPFEEEVSAEGGGWERMSPLPLNANTIPYLDPTIAVALLWGPVVAPSRGGGRGGEGLIQEPGSASRGTGEITGLMLPTLGGSGTPELSLDVALQGPVQMRVGERIFSRLVVTYVSPVSGPQSARSLGVTYEIVPPLVSIGWSVDERDWTRWELRGFQSF
jgi:autotransporter translocation and assembly factor TamB